MSTNIRDAKKAHSAESEVQSLPCTALYELSLLQHVHYYSSTCSSTKNRVDGEIGEKLDKSCNNDNDNDNDNDNIGKNNYNNNNNNKNNNHNDSNSYNKNSDHINGNKTRNGNSTKTVQTAETLSASENICTPIGIVSLPSSTSFPNASEQNSYLHFLRGGDFNSSLKKPQVIDYSSLLHENKKKSVKSFIAFPPIRFLVFPAIHISLPSILPLILSHTQKLHRKNQLLVINAKNTKYYEDEKSIANRETENTDLVITDSLPPPLCAYLARDLCSDLLNAVRHCIHW